jgi:hypothetical protein
MTMSMLVVFTFAGVEAREQLRRQVGTLRFDLNTLAQAQPKDAKKKALELKKVRGREVHAAEAHTGVCRAGRRMLMVSPVLQCSLWPATI